MNFYRKMVLAALLAVSSLEEANGAGYEKKWNYLLNGADWALDDKGTQCAQTNQSPIDLRTDLHSNPFPKRDGSEFKGTYINLKGATVKNLGKVVQVNMPVADKDGLSPDNYFQSKYMSEELGGKETFSAAQFHFHAKSEHTINGKRYDMEMHTVHLAGESSADKSERRLAESSATEGGKTDFFASALGIIFDRDDYDPSITAEERKTIDAFFDSMGFTSLPPS